MTPGRLSTRAAPRASTRAGSASCTRAVLEGTWGAFELDLEALLAASRDPIQYEDVITFPAVKQDLAFAVDEGVAAGDLIAAAREAAGPELRELRVFDVYRGEQIGPGKKSIAFAAAFQSPERTLSDEEAAEMREQDRRRSGRAVRRGAARLRPRNPIAVGSVVSSGDAPSGSSSLSPPPRRSARSAGRLRPRCDRS